MISQGKKLNSPFTLIDGIIWFCTVKISIFIKILVFLLIAKRFKNFLNFSANVLKVIYVKFLVKFLSPNKIFFYKTFCFLHSAQSLKLQKCFYFSFLLNGIRIQFDFSPKINKSTSFLDFLWRSFVKFYIFYHKTTQSNKFIKSALDEYNTAVFFLVFVFGSERLMRIVRKMKELFNIFAEML